MDKKRNPEQYGCIAPLAAFLLGSTIAAFVIKETVNSIDRKPHSVRTSAILKEDSKESEIFKGLVEMQLTQLDKMPQKEAWNLSLSMARMLLNSRQFDLKTD